ncbi:MAG: hypothetical protein R3F59_07950 [Myxococcota bacterium]
MWTLAGQGDSGLGDDFAVDTGSPGGGFSHQHAVRRLADGGLLMLDNEHGRALVLDLDEASGTNRVRAAYPTTDTACRPQGTAAPTPASTLLVGCSEGRCGVHRGRRGRVGERRAGLLRAADGAAVPTPLDAPVVTDATLRRGGR